MAGKISDWEKKFVRKSSGREIDHLTLHEKNGVVWFSFPILDQFDFVVNAFSTRIGGVSEGYASSMNLSLSRELSGGLGMSGVVTDMPEEEAWHSVSSQSFDIGDTVFYGGGAPAPAEERNSAAAAMSRFLENHRRLSEAVGYNYRNLVFSDQTHTDHVAEVTEENRGNGITRKNSFHDVDGMMTDRRNLAMMTFYADCVPLLMVDPVRKAAACIHSGWRGTIAGIGTKAVRQMVMRYGSDPADMVAAIGPSICGECYEVSDDVADRFREKYGIQNVPADTAKIVRPGREGHAWLDLQEACRQNFLMAGLSFDRVSVPDICTAENSSLMFSHRASGGKRGNLAAVLELR